MAYIEKITVNDETYDIADAQAREDISELNTSLSDLLQVTRYGKECTCNADSSSGVLTIDITPPSGYKNLGVIAHNTNNTNLTTDRAWMSDENTASIAYYNRASSSITNNQYVFVLQIKSSS